jgi:hypothetical protein
MCTVNLSVTDDDTPCTGETVLVIDGQPVCAEHIQSVIDWSGVRLLADGEIVCDDTAFVL